MDRTRGDIDSIARKVEPIGRKFPVKEIYLFGSRARGDNTQSSDYDFLVVPKEKMTAFKFCGLLIELENTFGSVDMVSSRSINKKFEERLNKDKVLVYAERYR